MKEVFGKAAPGECLYAYRQYAPYKTKIHQLRHFNREDGTRTHDTKYLCGAPLFSIESSYNVGWIKYPPKEVCHLCAKRSVRYRRRQALALYYHKQKERLRQKETERPGYWPDFWTGRRGKDLMGDRRLCRLLLDGETAWCEHISGIVYKVLNSCLDGTLAAFPSDSPHARWNGGRVRLLWGTLIEGTEAAEGQVRPIRAVGCEWGDDYEEGDTGTEGKVPDLRQGGDTSVEEGLSDAACDAGRQEALLV